MDQASQVEDEYQYVMLDLNACGLSGLTNEHLMQARVVFSESDVSMTVGPYHEEYKGKLRESVGTWLVFHGEQEKLLKQSASLVLREHTEVEAVMHPLMPHDVGRASIEVHIPPKIDRLEIPIVPKALPAHVELSDRDHSDADDPDAPPIPKPRVRVRVRSHQRKAAAAPSAVPDGELQQDSIDIIPTPKRRSHKKQVPVPLVDATPTDVFITGLVTEVANTDLNPPEQSLVRSSSLRPVEPMNVTSPIDPTTDNSPKALMKSKRSGKRKAKAKTVFEPMEIDMHQHELSDPESEVAKMDVDLPLPPPKKKRGRPRKTITAPTEFDIAAPQAEDTTKLTPAVPILTPIPPVRGRPKKLGAPSDGVATQPVARGRPKKIVPQTTDSDSPLISTPPARGRPKKVVLPTSESTELVIAQNTVAPPAAESTIPKTKIERPRGRPRKVPLPLPAELPHLPQHVRTRTMSSSK